MNLQDALNIWPQIKISKHTSDLTNQKFGRLTCLYRTTNDKRKKAVWVCQCECGNFKPVNATDLKKGNTQSCGCLKKECLKKINQNKIKDLTNQRFGKLTVINFLYTKNRRAYWACKCDCGNEIIVNSNLLLKEETSSCGCLKNSKKEELIKTILDNQNINYQKEYSFNDLKYKIKLRFDFALLNQDNQLLALIEYQGKQHFQNSLYGQEQREITDQLKKDYCKQHNITLYEITYKDNIEIKLQEILDIVY